ncbi:MAG: DUF1614 domain-containing protein [Dehalococcoidia bacterium]
MLSAQIVTIVVLAVLTALVVVIAFDLLTISFEKLGVSPWVTFAIFACSWAGSHINIPIWYGSHVVSGGRRIIFHNRWIFYQPPLTTQQIIAVNVGGAVIPVLFSLWLLPKAPFWRTVLATVVVAIVTHMAAVPIQGQGIEMPVWVAPVTAALLGLVLTGGNRAAPLAYIAGTIGTLIGADITNLYRLGDIGGGVLSIGGAGVFDGVFISGVVAALLSFDRTSRTKRPAHITA